MLAHENWAKRKGFRVIIGVDEAGRGPLAGPVVASAVLLRKNHFCHTIDDSKKLTLRQREAAFHEIFKNAYVGVGIVSESVIDLRNILQATHHAMTLAVEDLLSHLPLRLTGKKNFQRKVILFIDGNSFQSDLPFACKKIVAGDALSLSIACASIVAKVTRDRILHAYDKVFPHYGFRQHKGYPTLAHRAALREHGPSLIHRKTFQHTQMTAQ